MRRLVVFCAIAALLLSACSTNKPTPDDGSKAQQPLGAVTLPMAVPADTFVLARMDMQQVRLAYQHIDALARMGARDASGSSPEELPTLNAPVKVLLTAILAAETAPVHAIVDPSAVPADYMKGLAEQGTIFLAMSTAGNEPLMRAMQNRVPTTGSEMIPRGYFVRMRLPASEPEALEAWFEKACDESFRCGPSWAVEPGADAVTVEFRFGHPPGYYFESNGMDLTVAAPADDETYFSEPTAATRAFIDNQAALGIYLRSDELAAVGALQGMTEAFKALEHATPTNRGVLYQRGMQLAGTLFELLSPEAREVHDSTMLLTTGEQLGFVLDSVQSFTEVGARVAAAADADVSAGSLGEEAAIRAEIAYDVSESRAEAVTPGWMNSGAVEGPRDVARILRDSGIWGYALAAHNYPAGFGRGLTSIAVAEGGEEAVVVAQTEYLQGARVAMDLVASENSPMGFEPRGGIIAVFDKRADIERWVSQGNRMLERAPFPMSLDVVSTGGVKELRWLFGDDATVGEASAIPSTLHAVVDLAAMAEAMTTFQLPALDARRASTLVSPVMSELKSVELQSWREPAALHVRLNFGDSGVAPLELNGADEPIAQSTVGESCLDDARQYSGEAMRAFDHLSPGERVEMMSKTATRLGELQEDCEEHASGIQWMRARWLELAGTRLANALDFRRAIELFEEGCEIGDEDSCELAERARSPDIGAEFATVEGPVTAWMQDGRAMTVVGAKSVDRWQFQWPLGLAWSYEYHLDELDLSERDGREKVRGTLGETSSTGYPVVIDKNADAFVAALLAEEAHHQQTHGYQRFRRSNNREIGLLVPVEVEGRPELGRLELFGPTDTPGDHIRLEVGSDGVDAFQVQGGKATAIDAIDGCAADGPPICPDGTLKTGLVVIAVEQGVTFQRFARVAAAAQAGRTQSGQDVTLRLVTE